MKGNEYRDAIAAIEKVEASRHFRAETAHRAIGQVLGYLGARRVYAAVRGRGAVEALLLAELDAAETAAVALDAIAQRVETREERAAQWTAILTALRRARVYLEREHETARIAAARQVRAMIGSAAS